MADLSTYNRDQNTLNRRFARLLYESAINISHNDPDLIALREARRDHDYLSMGEILERIIDKYERENKEAKE